MLHASVVRLTNGDLLEVTNSGAFAYSGVCISIYWAIEDAFLPLGGAVFGVYKVSTIDTRVARVFKE